MKENLSQKFNENWQKNHAQFGQITWEQEADFCYFIESPLPLETAQALCDLAHKFKEDFALEGGSWLSPEEMHLTLTLPGRLGTHFQKNDLSFMKKTLDDITSQTPGFALELQNFNVFPTTLWAEVYDPTGRLQQLHETLCNEIPFSQHPEFRYTNYLPHISVAYGVQNPKPLGKEINRNFEPLTFSLESLTLGRAKWQGSELTKAKSAEYHLKKA
ncbi:2'-5' RNA ligase family protein [bacterium]|nr:2'-5' RNA ligase family protein [bacterium]NCQ54891.1 2'-5' RNA ligase family protein [Candidatus Parcubacteria bacterium]NCS66935.1 2'-5' RNA ligase family protein [Candidatus Peregrinibacteria bacterium]NCS95882.1 2'-5' RNA ligase family protein [bacterium]